MVYMYHPHTGRFEQSTRSTLRASTAGPFVGRGHRASTVGPYVGGGYHVSRRSYDDDVLYSPSRMYHRPYDTTGNEYATHGQINRELIMSTSAMEDNFDITNKSRARDRDVLAAANRAIVDTEIHSQPKYAVAARRAARCHSTPPAPAHYSRSEAALLGSKVEALMPERKRRPKSSYAQARVRNMERDRRVSGEPEAPVFVGETTSLKAHRPVSSQRPRHIWGRELFSYGLY